MISSSGLTIHHSTSSKPFQKTWSSNTIQESKYGFGDSINFLRLGIVSRLVLWNRNPCFRVSESSFSKFMETNGSKSVKVFCKVINTYSPNFHMKRKETKSHSGRAHFMGRKCGMRYEMWRLCEEHACSAMPHCSTDFIKAFFDFWLLFSLLQTNTHKISGIPSTESHSCP